MILTNQHENQTAQNLYVRYGTLKEKNQINAKERSELFNFNW